jgi:hypothetical protein
MGAKEAERPFLEKVCEYLVSLPFDLKILQEAVTDPDLDRAAREIAAGTIVHTISPQTEGEGPLKFADDVLFVRAALGRVIADGSEGAQAFKDRFSGEVYEKLQQDCARFEEYLGDVWPWLTGRLAGFGKIPYKGKKASQYVDDEEAATLLYEEGLEFQTNYNLSEEQVRNKVRRADQILELLNKKRAEEAKKKA